MSSMIPRKVAVITGASSGIGEALAQKMAAKGYALFLMARRLERLQELKIVLPQDRTEIFEGDVTKPEDLTAACAAALARFKTIDVVVANAGFGVSGSFESLSNEDFRKQFETNIYGVMNTARAFFPALKKSSGRIAIMGSVSSYVSRQSYAPYSMSKYAVRSLAESLYLEWLPQGVGVTFLAPGFVESEIRRKNRDGSIVPSDKDPIPPWMIMSRSKAATQILRAIEAGRREFVLTWHGRVFVFLSRHLPGLLFWMQKRISFSPRKNA